MRIQVTLALVLVVASVAACQFEWHAGSAPMLTGAAAAPPPPPRQTAAPAPTAKPTAAPTTGVASKIPVLGPADIQALLKGTWRNSIPPFIVPGVSGPGLAPVPGAPSCLSVSASATVPACAPHVPDAACIMSSLAARRCRAYATMMVPTVAAAAVTCVNRLTSAQLCDPIQIDNCGHAALAQACPDPATVGPLCQIASAPCKSPQVDCVELVSGLTADGQDAVARCVASGCSAGLYACVEGLDQ